MTRRADLTLARGIRQALAHLGKPIYAQTYSSPYEDALIERVEEVRDILAAALELYERDAPLIEAEAPPPAMLAGVGSHTEWWEWLDATAGIDDLGGRS